MLRKYLFFLLFSTCIFAQEVPRDSILPTQLSEVVISPMHINDSIMNAPAAIGILSQKDIVRNNASDISIPMNTVSGVYMQSGGYNTNRITIRGIGARTPYGTNKIRAFYGSIPLTSGDSETTIEDIDLENISQVEIIKGPLSSIYGAGLGGAIVISPKKSVYSGTSVSASSISGSFGLLKNNFNFSRNVKSSSLNISYHKLESDGWRENSHYNREGITIAGEIFRRKDSKLTYFGNYTFMKAFIPSSIDKATFENNPRAAAFTWKSAKGFERYDSYLGGLAYDWKINPKINNSTSIFLNHKESDEPRPFDILLQNTTGYGVRTQFSGNLDSKSKTNFIVGIEYFRDNFRGKTFENLYESNNRMGSLAGLLLTENTQNRSFYNGFAQIRMQFSNEFEMQTGLNVNQTSFNLNRDFPETDDTSESYRYDVIWSPQFSLLYKPRKTLTLYFSASRGFSLPSIEETLTQNGNVNPNIRPESGYNFEIGQKSWFLNKKLYTEISLYSMQINDLLVAKRIGDDQYMGINAGKTLHQGLEISAEYNAIIASGFSINPFVSASFGNYKFQEFVDNDTNYSGNELTGVPSNKINAGISLGFYGFYFSADFAFTDTIPLNDSNSAYSDAYKLVNLKTGWKKKINEKLNFGILAGINNVFNEHYASMVLVNATAFGNANPRYFYPGLPVNYYGGINLFYTF